MIIYKAQGSIGHPIPDLEITATEQLPAQPMTQYYKADLVAAHRLFEEQARELVDRLFASLPGGTIDAVLVEMLNRKASVLRVLA